MSASSDVAKAIEAHNMMAAASSNAFTAGVIGVGKPMAVAEKNKEIEQEKPKPKPSPKMRTGPNLGPRKASKVSDIF